MAGKVWRLYENFYKFIENKCPKLIDEYLQQA